MLLSLAACAHSSAPAASVQTHPAWLVGNWQASGWQVGASKDEFQRNTTVTFASDGTWKALAGGSGTSWLAGNDVVLDGTTASGAPIRYKLRQRQTASGPELWGTVPAPGGSAELTLKKMR